MVNRIRVIFYFAVYLDANTSNSSVEPAAVADWPPYGDYTAPLSPAGLTTDPVALSEFHRRRIRRLLVASAVALDDEESPNASVCLETKAIQQSPAEASIGLGISHYFWHLY